MASSGEFTLRKLREVWRHSPFVTAHGGKECRFIRRQVCQSYSVGFPPESPNLTLMVSISMAIVMLEKRQKTTYPEARCF